MEIEKFVINDNENVSTLLTNCTPYVLPHHPYIYWIMCEYFPSLCFVAKEDDAIIGFVCSLHSTEKNSIFIWQLAVDNAYRQIGVAKLLCEKIINYSRSYGLNSIQMTINSENVASVTFFSSLARQYGTSLKRIDLTGLDRFNDEIAYEIKL